MLLDPICFECIHRLEKLTCDAFPQDIPDEILFGHNDHSKPLPGQGNNIVFKQKPKAGLNLKPVRFEEISDNWDKNTYSIKCGTETLGKASFSEKHKLWFATLDHSFFLRRNKNFTGATKEKLLTTLQNELFEVFRSFFVLTSRNPVIENANWRKLTWDRLGNMWTASIGVDRIGVGRINEVWQPGVHTLFIGFDFKKMGRSRYVRNGTVEALMQEVSDRWRDYIVTFLDLGDQPVPLFFKKDSPVVALEPVKRDRWPKNYYSILEQYYPNDGIYDMVHNQLSHVLTYGKGDIYFVIRKDLAEQKFIFTDDALAVMEMPANADGEYYQLPNEWAAAIIPHITGLKTVRISEASFIGLEIDDE